eukprot:11640105-Alexandrium_andersonii.AAC.1
MGAVGSEWKARANAVLGARIAARCAKHGASNPSVESWGAPIASDSRPRRSEFRAWRGFGQRPR